MSDSPRADALASPLLETKLFVPRWRADLVARPALIVRLNRGARGKLTLVSAPAGFGKSTLLAEWVTQATESGYRLAWVSLDPHDNEPGRFWVYVITSLRRASPEIGQIALTLLQSSQPTPIETVLTTLINDLASVEHDLVLILDDFHAIESQSIHQAMDFLLDHLPPRAHLVIAGRSDPPLSLARLRARGEAIELRVADLRFTPEEAAAFLNEVMGLNLSADNVAALERRTEGWIAGLQLAALSLRGRDDAASFIRAFAGDHRFIVDYLLDEVLQRQPERLRRFLLQTSILDRLSAPLCDAVTGCDDGRALLGELERSNLFIVPLDDRRQWYRYHHLFGDVLRVHALAEEPESVSTWHLRASDWYAHNGYLTDAVQHALAAGAFTRAADLIERALPELRAGRQEVTVLGWLKLLPDDLLRHRPVLSVAHAWVLLSTGRLEGVDDRLRDAEQWLDITGGTPERSGFRPDEMIVVNEEEFRRLPGVIAIYRAGHALIRGDVAATVKHAQRALDLVPAEDRLVRGSAAGMQGLAFWTMGDLEAARRAYAFCQDNVLREGYVSDALGCGLALADILLTQGRLREAMQTYEQGVRLATELGEPALRGTADMFVGMSELECERNDLAVAMQLLLRSEELGESGGLPQNPYRRRVALARVRQAQGDRAGALVLLDEAERVYAGDFFPEVRPVAAVRARAWIGQGRLSEALRWAQEQGLSTEDELSYLREFEHITLARLLLAQAGVDRDRGTLRETMDLLERLRHAAEQGGRAGSLIEILILQALALFTQGNQADALEALGRALTLAEPEGYVRIFVDEGPPMARLLEAVKRAVTPHYTRDLLAAFGAPAQSSSGGPDMIEPLSERERAVLRLLASELGGPQIADELTISLNTLRTHTKNIYSKLGVTSRRAAVRRAEELELL